MSKFILFDFRCEVCSHKFDCMVKPDVFTAPCTECNGEARRLVSTPRFDPRMGLDAASFPTMGDKWARTHEQARKIEEERFAKHGE